MKQGTAKLAALVLAGSLATACGGADSGSTSDSLEGLSWDDVVAQAEKEGEAVLYYPGQPDCINALVSAFENEYPNIDVQIVRAGDAELLPRVDAELRSGVGVADVQITGEKPYMRAASEAGNLVKVIGPNFENPDLDAAQAVPTGDWFQVDGTVFGFGWNTDRVPEGVATWDDFLSVDGAPIGILDPTVSPSITAFYDIFINSEAGPEYLPKLAEKNTKIYGSVTQIEPALAAGEIGSAIAVTGSLETWAERAAPVDFRLPEGNAMSFKRRAGIPRVAPHPAAAQVLADYLVSAAGQEALASGKCATVLDVPGSVGLLADLTEPDVADMHDVQQRIAEFNTLFRR